jgi:hypothetical protein
VGAGRGRSLARVEADGDGDNGSRRGSGDERWRGAVSHPISEGKPNANYVRARIRIHVHSDYINEHHRTVLE